MHAPLDRVYHPNNYRCPTGLYLLHDPLTLARKLTRVS